MFQPPSPMKLPVWNRLWKCLEGCTSANLRFRILSSAHSFLIKKKLNSNIVDLKCSVSFGWCKYFFFFLAAPSCLWDLSSLSRNQTQAPAVEAQSLNHWTTREVPPMPLFQAPWLPSQKYSCSRRGKEIGEQNTRLIHKGAKSASRHFCYFSAGARSCACPARTVWICGLK